MVKIAIQCINFLCVQQCCQICYIRMAIFTTLRGKIHDSIQHKLQNSMEVDNVGIIAILSIPYITTRIVKIQTSVAKIPRVIVENQITTLSVVKIDKNDSQETKRSQVQTHFRPKCLRNSRRDVFLSFFFSFLKIIYCCYYFE